MNLPSLGAVWIKQSFLLFFLFGLLLILQGCEQEDVFLNTNLPKIQKYIHIAHTRGASNSEMATDLDKIDYQAFKMRWLGGDMEYGTSQDDLTMQYMEAIFHVRDVNTLWSLGNHDYGNLARVRNFTFRPNYYTYSRNGITLIVLDTQDSLSNIIGAQKAFFDSVVDTMQHSTHLIILHHKLIWMPDDPILEPLIPTISNIGIGTDFNSLNRNNFYRDLYPKLIDVHARGIEVLCLGGDMGNFDKQFEYQTPDGIYFLGSGVSYLATNDENMGLEFSHDLDKGKLSWKFVSVADLLTQ